MQRFFFWNSEGVRLKYFFWKVQRGPKKCSQNFRRISVNKPPSRDFAIFCSQRRSQGTRIIPTLKLEEGPTFLDAKKANTRILHVILLACSVCSVFLFVTKVCWPKTMDFLHSYTVIKVVLLPSGQIFRVFEPEVNVMKFQCWTTAQTESDDI